MKIVPATQEMFKQLDGQPVHRTVRAWAAIDDAGDTVAIAGLYPNQHSMVMFATLTDKARRNKRLMVVGVRKMIEAMGKYKIPVHAVACPTIKGSDVLLKHLGFKHHSGDLYEWQP